MRPPRVRAPSHAFALALALIFVPGFAGTVSAQGAGAPDAWVTLGPGTVLENDPRALMELNDSSDARWAWDLNLTKPLTVIEFQGQDLGLARTRQLVPSLVVSHERYPLFHFYPNERVWEAESPSQLFHVTGTPDDLVLRVGIPGPARIQLVVEIDAIAPSFDVGPAQNVSAIGFYVETQTTELALGDLQVRKVGAEQWVRNPTPEYHVLQRFPIQGLDPDADHEAQVVFEDWAGNVATSPIFQVRTLPAPEAQPVVVRPLEPAPNAMVSPDGVTVRASITSGSPVTREGIRVFFDLQEVTDFEVHGADVRYVPPGPLEPGFHRVSVEVTDAAGGKGDARWGFDVEKNGAPLPTGAWTILVLIGAATLVRRASRP